MFCKTDRSKKVYTLSIKKARVSAYFSLFFGFNFCSNFPQSMYILKTQKYGAENNNNITQVNIRCM